MQHESIRALALTAVTTITLSIYTAGPGISREVPTIKSVDLRDQYIEQQEAKSKAEQEGRQQCETAQQSFKQLQRYGEGGESLFGIDLKGGVWTVSLDRSGHCQINKDFVLGIEKSYRPGRSQSSRKELVLFTLENERLCRYRRVGKNKPITVFCYSHILAQTPGKRSLIFH